MKTPISRTALEKVYNNSLKPFLDGLSNTFEEFKDMFDLIEVPDYGLELLDDLDPILNFKLWEFREKPDFSLTLVVEIHFNRYDFEIVLFFENFSFKQQFKFTYEEKFLKQDQSDAINIVGLQIVSNIKSEFPDF
ncbi:MAG: hypothetical protein MK207_09990 [Saprospiraceae bacterium]|nr:hypothetical protein [Saprospiraceae bacterium]